MKVWGWMSFLRGTQARTLVCAKNQKRAVELLNEVYCNVSLYSFRQYWAETGNAHELNAANCEGVWVNMGDDYQKHFKRWRKRAQAE
jgi:hypothetical protein